MRTRWIRVALAGVTMLSAGVLVACGGDDSAGAEGGTGDSAPTATPRPLDEATATPESNSPGTGTGSQPAPPSFPASDQPPVTTASVGNQSVETGIGTFCWTMLCVDKIGVPTQGTLTVTAGDIVSVEVPEGAPALNEASAHVFEAVDAQSLDDGSEIWPYPGSLGNAVEYEITDDSVDVSVELAPGRYVLAVSMYFERGDVVYGVLLEVE